MNSNLYLRKIWIATYCIMIYEISNLVFTLSLAKYYNSCWYLSVFLITTGTSGASKTMWIYFYGGVFGTRLERSQTSFLFFLFAFISFSVIKHSHFWNRFPPSWTRRIFSIFLWSCLTDECKYKTFRIRLINNYKR